MSLVLEALRRVEKPNERTGSIGAAVSSYRPTPRRRGFAIPLLLGFAVGGAALLLFTPPSGQRKATPGSNSNGVRREKQRRPGRRGVAPACRLR